MEIVFYKIEKGQQAGKSGALGLRLATLGNLIYEIKNVIGG